MAKIINQNILKVKEGIICHQTNCMGKMGAGIALKIRKKWPKVYKNYIKRYNEGYLKLGFVDIVKINPTLFVANCCGQYYYGRKGKFTNYIALKSCFNKVKIFSDTYKLQIYIPYKIGCSLAGGDWQIVKSIIDEEIPESVICRWK